MKRKILLLNILLFLSTSVFADTKCFLVKKNNNVIKQEGDCKSRYAPCSTFKIAISLMGYEEKLLIDENNPELPFKEGYTNLLDVWKQAHNPLKWMKNSCVWYSQILTKKLGMNKLKDYIEKFSYGNQDLSGDEGKNNGLTNAWLSSSLEISSEEQAVFLQSLLENNLPVRIESHEMTRNILFLEELPGGWKLYGKTGSGVQLSKDRMRKLDLQHGWFLGWIQKNGRSIIFVNHITDDSKQDTYASLRAKAEAKEKLIKLIQDNNL